MDLIYKFKHTYIFICPPLDKGPRSFLCMWVYLSKFCIIFFCLNCTCKMLSVTSSLGYFKRNERLDTGEAI